MRPPGPLRIGTRGSRLALTQAQLVADGLAAAGHPTVVVPLSTAGDRNRRQTFAELGARGVFVREIEAALLDGEVDVAVHSAKDLTGEDHPDLAIGACLERGDPRDAWCGPAATLDDVPSGARVGTASLRRASQLRALRPDHAVEGVRGNVDTRLRNRGERGLDAVVLAACGLDRLGLAGEIGFRLPVPTMIPESGQGVIAVQTRRGEEHLVEALDHPPSHQALRAERACTRTLAGGCSVPVAAHAVLTGASWQLWGYVGRPDGTEALVETAAGDDATALGEAVAASLLARGGARLLEDART